MYHLRHIGGSNLNISDGLKHGCILHQNIIQNDTKDRMHNFVYVTKASRSTQTVVVKHRSIRLSFDHLFLYFANTHICTRISIIDQPESYSVIG